MNKAYDDHIIYHEVPVLFEEYNRSGLQDLFKHAPKTHGQETYDDFVNWMWVNLAYGQDLDFELWALEVNDII